LVDDDYILASFTFLDASLKSSLVWLFFSEFIGSYPELILLPRSPPSPRITAPVFHNRRSAGRNKFRHWEEDISKGSCNDELTSSATRIPYLDIARNSRKALRATPPPQAGASGAAQSAVAMEETHPEPARGRRKTSAPAPRTTTSGVSD